MTVPGTDLVRNWPRLDAAPPDSSPYIPPVIAFVPPAINPRTRLPAAPSRLWLTFAFSRPSPPPVAAPTARAQPIPELQTRPIAPAVATPLTKELSSAGDRARR